MTLPNRSFNHPERNKENGASITSLPHKEEGDSNCLPLLRSFALAHSGGNGDPSSLPLRIFTDRAVDLAALGIDIQLFTAYLTDSSRDRSLCGFTKFFPELLDCSHKCASSLRKARLCI
ncbi:MAG TPA: hypothetical protein VMC44_01280 [Geobacteraceae bacterium]|nr:hypothetical protein [Geobacteraceae bacterium]